MDIKKATLKLKTIHSSLKAMATFAKQFNSETNNLSQVRVRLEELPSISEKFEEVQSVKEELDQKVDEVVMDERASFREKFYEVKASLLHILEVEESKKSEITSPSYSITSNHVNTNMMKLPPIELPKFSGDWKEWTSFIDSFNVYFHNNKDMAPVHKLHFLKACLEGQASDIVKSIPTTNENYEQAYDAVTARYENKGAIIQSHIRALFDTPKISIASVIELQRLYHHITSNINALQALGQPIESWDAWLVTLICNRMDRVTVGEWHIQYNKKDLPEFKEIKAFLFNRIAAYEAGEVNVGVSCIKQNVIKSSNKFQEKKVFFAKPTNKLTTSNKCHFCNETHRLYQCKGFNDLKVPDRREFVAKKRLCFNCLYSNHQAQDCRFSSCPKCGRKHNSKLHMDQDHENQQTCSETEPIASTSALCVNKGIQQSMHASGDMVMLATAVVYIIDATGCPQPCRALLDSGSQINFVTDACAQFLGLSKTKCVIPIVGINSMKSDAHRLQPVVMYSRFENFNVSLDLHVLPSIANDMPSRLIHLDQSKIPDIVNEQLADPSYDTPGRIDILLGAEMFYTLFSGERVAITNSLVFHKTTLGWVLTGRVLNSEVIHSKFSACVCDNNSTIQSALSLFISKSSVRKDEEDEAEQHFKMTHYRDDSGRLVVSLPLNTKLSSLGESKHMAQQRFFNLEKRLSKDRELCIAYHKFMSEYLDMNHMELVTNVDSNSQTYYLPHHAVIKEDSITTKLRVVFDGSAPTSSGLSLNDVMLRGPIVQSSLFSILLRFRVHKIALTADVEKMYRQILVTPKDCQLQRIWYRPSPSELLREYSLRTITYGTKSAPYLATRSLVEVALSAPSEIVQRAIKDDFYVDDLLTGAESSDECFQLYKDVSDTLASHCLPLRKWCTSSSEVLSKLPNSGTDPNHVLQLGEQDAVSTLGIMWQPTTDCFRFTLKPWNPPKKMTKRTLLSDINRIYDPLGFLTPILISGKIFVQQLWVLKIDWDTTLPDDMQQRWKNFYLSLYALDKLTIPRRTLSNNWSYIQLHGFCDASQEAYGACIYARTQNSNGEFKTSLYVSKSRVAPLHATTIPRLELCGAVLLSDLTTEVISELKKLNIILHQCDVILWSDSTVVIAWINSTQPLKSYVSNRIAQILDNTDKRQWNHVPTDCNPADIITRGQTVDNLQQCSMWWNGPHWLSQHHTSWPTRTQPTLNELPEVRPVKLVLQASAQPVDDYPLNKFSKWNHMVRVTAYMLRFISNAKETKNQTFNCQSGVLTVNELQNARNVWLRYAQHNAFRSELNSLTKSKSVASNSRLKRLNPFIDTVGLIRVGGRLDYLVASEERRHPVVLPPKGKIVKMIFEQMHLELLHIGPQGLLANIQLLYWPLRGRNLSRSTYHNCNICFRAKPSMLQPKMAPIPRSRISVQRAFSRTGVDFCGPIFIKSGIRRVKSIKSYIAVFVCFSTRAVHLELVSGLSSDAFIAALTRFIARRGPCLHLHSDNGTNFVGANRELSSYFKAESGKQTVIENMTQQGVTWHFNPPSAPHFGGIWEAAVKSAKVHLFKLSNKVLLTFEETTTLLCRIEAILNSRPLTPLANDPSDYAALTPGHFLVGGPILLPPEPDSTSIPQNRLHRFALVRAQMQWFWKRWSQEYLPQIQKRNKWLKPQRNLVVGDLVIVKEENLPPLHWKLGRVLTVHPGNDDVVRVVTIRMGNGHVYKRPVAKLALLPTVNDEEEEEHQLQQR
uniref:Integrase catalytic domain-containing protein n=1 Tax=Schizaphis graminum TaxID=13262 RepID=A0A2S2N7B6_SCHGA